MSRKPRTIETVHANLGVPGRKSPKHRQRKPADLGMDKREITTLVCKYICEGRSATEASDLMKRNHGITMSREKPYEYFAYAASQGWIHFRAPTEVYLRERLRKRYNWLREAEVVHTANYDDVALHGAEMLISLLKKHRHQYQKKEVHVGFAGGYAMRSLAHSFSDQLRQHHDGLPDVLYAHALTGGFDSNEPSTTPNAFFTWLHNDPSMQLQTRFVGFEGPLMVPSKYHDDFRNIPGVRESYEGAEKLDIIVTSASCLEDEHCSMHRLMEKSTNTMQMLRANQCVGDMLWQPLADSGPLDKLPLDIQALTVMRLNQLPGFIDQAKDVLLVIGPCGHCHHPKSRILNTILNVRPHLISHLVTDSRAVRDILGEDTDAD